MLDHFDRGQMLRVAQDELRDADATRFADRLAQQRVRALAALGRDQVVGRLEEPIVDLVGLHEVDDVDGARLLERRRLEVFLGEDDEAALRVLVALDEIFPRDGWPSRMHTRSNLTGDLSFACSMRNFGR